MCLFTSVDILRQQQLGTINVAVGLGLFPASTKIPVHFPEWGLNLCAGPGYGDVTMNTRVTLCKSNFNVNLSVQI